MTKKDPWVPYRRTVRGLQADIKRLMKTPELRRNPKSYEEYMAQAEFRAMIYRQKAELEREIVYYRMRMPPFMVLHPEGFYEQLPVLSPIDPYEKV